MPASLGGVRITTSSVSAPTVANGGTAGYVEKRLSPSFFGANNATNHLHRHGRCYASYRSLGGSAATIPAIPKAEHCEVSKALSSQVPKALTPKVSEAALIVRVHP